MTSLQSLLIDGTSSSLRDSVVVTCSLVFMGLSYTMLRTAVMSFFFSLPCSNKDVEPKYTIVLISVCRIQDPHTTGHQAEHSHTSSAF